MQYLPDAQACFRHRVLQLWAFDRIQDKTRKSLGSSPCGRNLSLSNCGPQTPVCSFPAQHRQELPQMLSQRQQRLNPLGLLRARLNPDPLVYRPAQELEWGWEWESVDSPCLLHLDSGSCVDIGKTKHCQQHHMTGHGLTSQHNQE